MTKKNDKKHWTFFDNIQVDCICGNSFSIWSTIQWPLKTETCYSCHPAYNKDKVVKKVSKWRMEKFLEKQKKINSIKN